MLRVKDLMVRLRDATILKGISCSLEPGRITLLIGKSGAGKTTLLRSMAGLVPITQGEITVNGNDLCMLSSWQRAHEIGYVFQDFNLFANLTVLQNCIDPLLVQGVAYEQAERRAYRILQQLEMADFLHAYPVQLSGGQQQRVAVARALCLQPCILLLDEPTASLDPLNSDILVTILRQLAQQGLTIALSSQDMSFVRKLFDRVYYLQAGTIVEVCDDITAVSSCLLIEQFIFV